MKRCSKCGVEKSEDCFRVVPDKRRGPWRMGKCRDCMKVVRRVESKKRYERNAEYREWIKDYNKKYYVNNEPSIKRQTKEYASKHIDQVNGYKAKWIALNRDKYIASSRKQTEKLSDALILKYLRREGFKDASNALIELKRMLILLKRKLKQYGKQKKPNVAR